MYGKVVQLIDDKIIYGLDELDYNHPDKIYDFAEVTFTNLSPNSTKKYINKGFCTVKYSDKYRKVILFNGDLSKDKIEDTLIVIITCKNGSINTNTRKIASCDTGKAIIAMNAGDTVEIEKDNCRTIYMAVQAGNELFLVKKER